VTPSQRIIAEEIARLRLRLGKYDGKDDVRIARAIAQLVAQLGRDRPRKSDGPSLDDVFATIANERPPP
jgi:hypothetical protein